jgi:predicted DCC family thiol-disulfide oxidoreductase YuxK
VGEPYSYRRDPAVPAFADDLPIVIFDDHCAMCSGSARFVLRHDRRGAFRLWLRNPTSGARSMSITGSIPATWRP